MGRGVFLLSVAALFVYAWAPAALWHHRILSGVFLVGSFCVTWAVFVSDGQH